MCQLGSLGRVQRENKHQCSADRNWLFDNLHKSDFYLRIWSEVDPMANEENATVNDVFLVFLCSAITYPVVASYMFLYEF